MLLSAEHISLNFGLKQLLDDVTLYLNEGDKVGVIGINGTGKSTFLKVLAGQSGAGQRHRSPGTPTCRSACCPRTPQMEEDATVLEQVFLRLPRRSSGS